MSKAEPVSIKIETYNDAMACLGITASALRQALAMAAGELGVEGDAFLDRAKAALIADADMKSSWATEGVTYRTEAGILSTALKLIETQVEHARHDLKNGNVADGE